ncbi:hypothetical protein ACHAXS_009510 [Conticribra weissflogii]
MMNAPSSGSKGVGDANSPTGSNNSDGGNLYGLTPEQATREFDALRREATKLERHLEDRVARYQQSLHA